MNVVDGFLMVTAVVGALALWWAFARGRFPRALAVVVACLVRTRSSHVGRSRACTGSSCRGRCLQPLARPPRPCDGGGRAICDDGTESSVAWASSRV